MYFLDGCVSIIVIGINLKLPSLSLSLMYVSRNELGLPARSSWVQHDRQCSSPRGSVAIPLVTSPTRTFPRWLDEEYKPSAPSVSCLHASAALPNSLASMTSRVSRLEVLKSTATSLSNRIESEARKLLLTCKGGQSSELGADLPNHWARVAAGSSIGTVPKPESPEEENLQKLLCLGLTSYDGPLPGVGHLGAAFRESQERAADTGKGAMTPGTADSVLSRQRDGSLRQAEEEPIMSSHHHNHYGSNESSISEGSLAEWRAASQQPTKPSLHVALLDMERVQPESTPLHNISVFSSGTETCRLFSSTIPQDLDASMAAWRELTKGSPHSVINIFTKNLPSSSRGQFHIFDSRNLIARAMGSGSVGEI